MTWHVLGAGSLGMLWAARLAKAGLDPRLILRKPSSLSAFKAAGGIRFCADGQEQLITLSAQTADHPEPIERLVLACKAYDAEAAINGVAHRLKDTACVLLLQNGLGSQSEVATRIPHIRCILLSSTEGAFRSGDFSVTFAGQGTNWLGDPLDANPPAWLDELIRAGIPAKWTPSIMHRQWRKLAVNCAINPLCVLNNCLNGGLLEHHEEVASLCTELGALLEASAGKGASEGLHAEVQQVIVATARNQCSMLQDVRRQQRSEISYLLGFACAQARREGLHLPRLELLHTQLRHHLQSLGLRDD
jgi:2-dehydropantoate 2-reductase